MAKTNAEKQREYRQRHARRIAALEEDNERLADALGAETARLTGELDSARTELSRALEEIERLRAMACRHPSMLVDNGTCRGCGADVY